jgi:hypothetical protein
MAQNCKCVVGIEDPKAVIRKELAAGYDGYCKDAFSRGWSAMSFQEWMIDRLIEARTETNGLRAQAEIKVAMMHERIEHLSDDGLANGIAALHAAVARMQKPLTIPTMDPSNIEHWKRRALKMLVEEINKRLRSQDRTKELETRIEEYQARYKKRVMECAELSRRLEEIAGIANR